MIPKLHMEAVGIDSPTVAHGESIKTVALVCVAQSPELARICDGERLSTIACSQSHGRNALRRSMTLSCSRQDESTSRMVNEKPIENFDLSGRRKGL
jgi:hypothetical protein